MLSSTLYKLVGATAAFCAAVHAGPVNLGLISFDVLTPGTSNSAGVDAFNIFNFTGDPNSGGFALPPDFPVVTPITFTVTSLAWQAAGGLQTVLLGDIDPGQLAPPPDLQFPDGTPFSSAMFSATLSQTNLTLSDGSTFIASPDIQAVILPSSGNSLAAGTDFAVISATSTIVNNTPEPASWILVLGGLTAAIGGYRFRTRKQRISASPQ